MSNAVNVLSRMFSDICISGNYDGVDRLMSSMLSLMSQGSDLSSLAGSVIKLFAVPHLPLKKVLSTYLIRYSEDISDLNILVTNSLLKDFEDPNPQVRRLAVKTSCCIPCLKDLALDILPKALEDTNAHVRKTAASHCSRVVDTSRASHDIIHQLYSLLRDPDATIVSSSLLSLDEILEHEGGIVINRKLFEYLVDRMTSLPEWSFAVVCSALKKYQPSKEDVIVFLNVLDDKLISNNPTICILASELALLFVREHYENLELDIIERTAKTFMLLLNTSSSEALYAVLEILELLILRHRQPFLEHSKLFFCRFVDADYVKVKKISILPLLLSDENSSEVIEELLLCCTDKREVMIQAVSSLMSILHSSPKLFGGNVQVLMTLMHLNNNIMTEQLTTCLGSFNFNQIGEWKVPLLDRMLEEYQQVETVRGKEALMHIISHHGDSMHYAPYVLEQLFSQVENRNEERLYMSFLLAAVKLFLWRPAEMQLLLGQILQEALRSDSAPVKSRALLYYNLLKHDPQLTIQILNKKT